MNKLFLIAGALLLAGTAHAETLVSGPYVALRGGANYGIFKPDNGEKDHKTTIAFLPAAGIRVKSFRAEFEWGNLSRAKFEDVKYHQQRYMAQFYYEIPFRSKFRPFLNAGIGASYVESNYHHNRTRKSGDDTTFAWNAGAGLTFNWTRMWSFDVGYRFVDAGKATIHGENIKIQNHEGYAGVRLTF